MKAFDEFASELLCGTFEEALPKAAWKTRLLITPSFSQECCIEVTCRPLERKLHLVLGCVRESQLWLYFNQLTRQHPPEMPMIGIRIAQAQRTIALPRLKTLEALTPIALRCGTQRNAIVCDGVGVHGWFQAHDSEVEKTEHWNLAGEDGPPGRAAIAAIDLSINTFAEPVLHEFMTSLKQRYVAQ
jgi:hypothetical protein